MDYLGLPRIGIPLGWTQSQYPGRGVVYAEAFLASEAVCEFTRTPDQFRHRQLPLQFQAAQAAEEGTGNQSLGHLPIVRGMNATTLGSKPRGWPHEGYLAIGYDQRPAPRPRRLGVDYQA